MSRERKFSVKGIIGIYLLFLVIWAVRVAVLKGYVDGHYTLWTREIINGTIKSVVWVGFALYFITRYQAYLDIGLREMFQRGMSSKVLLPVLGFFVVYYTLGMFIRHGGFYFRPDFHPSELIGAFLLVGILEELVFRGWFYNALAFLVSKKNANLISSVMFTVIHYPGWIAAGKPPADIIFMSVSIFLLSLVFGWAFGKDRSIWTPVLLHMAWDLFSITVV